MSETKKPGRPRKYQAPVERQPKKKKLKAPRLSLKLTPALISQAAQLTYEGKTNRQVATLLGVPAPTYNSWIQQGRKKLEEEEYEHLTARLVFEVEHAKTLFESEIVEQLEDQLAQGIRASDQRQWVTTRLRFSSPLDFTERAFDELDGQGSMSQEMVDEALAHLKEKLLTILAVVPPEPEEIPTDTEPTEEEA